MPRVQPAPHAATCSPTRPRDDMPTRPRTNPRRHPCTWCNAPTTSPCVGPAGRELTWYHAPRAEAAERDPDPDQHPPGRQPLRPDPRDLRDHEAHRGREPLQGLPDRATTAAPRRNHLRQRPHPTEPLAPLGGPTRHQRAADWLHHQLTTLGGTAPAADLIQAAHAAGYSRTTLHRARQRLHIQTEKTSYLNGWTWNLPTQPLEPSIPHSAMTSLTEAAQLALSINTRAKRARP